MNQQELIPAAHAMKVTERGRVQGLSVAFARRAVSQSGAFREQLQRTLAKQIRTVGKFTVQHVTGRTDWFIVFLAGCDERVVDDALREVASNLNVLIYIEPGIPAREMTTDLSSFFFKIDPKKRQPGN